MIRTSLGFLMLGCMLSCSAQEVRSSGRRLVIGESWGVVEVYAVAPDVVCIDTHPTGVRSIPTDVLDPKGLRTAKPVGTVHGDELTTARITVKVSGMSLTITDRSAGTTLGVDLNALQSNALRLTHASGENLYGMRGNGLFGPRDPRLTPAKGLLRNDGAPVAAGSQGDGGAPIAYSTTWGVLIDSVDGRFATEPGFVTFDGDSRKDLEAYIVLGPPKRTIEAVNLATGRPPMPPKWALGFMNSQWGTDEKLVKSIVDEYRQKQIPIDAFIFDFDFKAWGEDNYGEWRWNSTNGPGNVGPMKYPDGQSGLFGKQMAAKGVHLVGIMKPRALTQNVELQPTKAAAEATAHNWWMPGKKPYQDYFSHRLANDFDFSKPDLRAWFWKHSRNLFETGLSGWWNDEADDGFDSLGFLHMQQSLFEGQESASNRRVWSINRNFYLGAQRFAFGTWSGDIGTGFQTMAAQRARMLMLTDLGQSHWSMDTGGFNGHPDPENYARWMEFAAVVPIMRVHGTYGQRRQPWTYGPVAEAAAKAAIDWRYSMFPSLYSWEHHANMTGIGIVRPLFWEFPDDPQCANITESWMLGDELLVSPVVEKGQRSKQIYLPKGRWFNRATDAAYDGGGSVEVSTDPLLWSDIPMFVRSGSILASQPVEQFAGQTPVTELTLDVWPDASHTAHFEVYDDDGETRGYEHGDFMLQRIDATKTAAGAEIDFLAPKGRYRSTISQYRVRIHGQSAAIATWNGAATNLSTQSSVTEVEIPAGQAGRLVFDVSMHHA